MQGRYKSLLIDKNEYLIACGRYIELNPVRAKIVKDPKDYRWSSYNVYTYGKKDSIIDYNPLYFEIGSTDEERRKNYRRPMQEESLKINLNMRFLGKENYIISMEERFGISNIRNKRGRPRKQNK